MTMCTRTGGPETDSPRILNTIAFLLAAVVLGLSATGCIVTSAKLKPEATIGAERAHEWVERDKGIGLDLLATWRDSLYREIDSQWSQVYASALKMWTEKKGAPPASPQDMQDVAGLAVLVRDARRAQVSERYGKALGILEQHYGIGLGLTGSVHANLESIAAVRAEERSLLNWIAEAANLDNGAVESIINSALGTPSGGTP